MSTNQYEAARASFRPGRTRVLFIGESRPAGGTFFFCGDSRLAKYTREAFERVFGPFLDMNSFLQGFQRSGCYLVDLCSTPVNTMADTQRKAKRSAGVISLSAALAELKPYALVVVITAIAPFVIRAARAARRKKIPCDVLPFPAQGHQRAYADQLSTILARLRTGGVLLDAR